MEDIVTDTSPESMARANEANLAVLGALIESASGADVLSFGETQVFFTGIPFPMFNGTTHVRLSEEDADGAIERALAEAEERMLPMMWWLTPGSRPVDVGERLAAHGFHLDDPAPGMGADLDTLSAEDLPSGVTIERVADSTGVHLWTQTLVAGFGFPDWLIEPTEQLMGRMGLGEDAPMQHYLARLLGQPVAVASVAFGGGVAGIYNVATLTEARGRGIGRAVTLLPLLDARARGYRVGVLQSSSMGFPVYRSLGFQQVCDVFMCVWPGRPAETADRGDLSQSALQS